MLEVRCQGSRPTCLAFATSAANENLGCVGEHLSVEYLYYHAVARTQGANPHAGTTMEAAAAALLHDGQPAESHWPYLDVISTAWAPPSGLAPIHRGALVVGKLSFGEIADELEAARPVVLGMLITDRFYVPDSDGRVLLDPTDTARGGHAILAVGHGTDATAQYLLVRNSWGPAWGLNGHAWLRQDYVRTYLHQTATIAKG